MWLISDNKIIDGLVTIALVKKLKLEENEEKHRRWEEERRKERESQLALEGGAAKG